MTENYRLNNTIYTSDFQFIYLFYFLLAVNDNRLTKEMICGDIFAIFDGCTMNSPEFHFLKRFIFPLHVMNNYDLTFILEGA